MSSRWLEQSRINPVVLTISNHDVRSVTRSLWLPALGDLVVIFKNGFCIWRRVPLPFGSSLLRDDLAGVSVNKHSNLLKALNPPFELSELGVQSSGVTTDGTAQESNQNHLQLHAECNLSHFFHCVSENFLHRYPQDGFFPDLGNEADLLHGSDR